MYAPPPRDASTKEWLLSPSLAASLRDLRGEKLVIQIACETPPTDPAFPQLLFSTPPLRFQVGRLGHHRMNWPHALAPPPLQVPPRKTTACTETPSSPAASEAQPPGEAR